MYRVVLLQVMHFGYTRLSFSAVGMAPIVEPQSCRISVFEP